MSQEDREEASVVSVVKRQEGVQTVWLIWTVDAIVQSPSKEEKQEGLEEARILGQEKEEKEKEKEREKAPEQAKPEEQGDKTVQVRGLH